MRGCESTPLVLFSGIAASADIVAPQKLAFPQLVVPGWPVPSPSDTLESYCERLADSLRPLGRIVIGGVSFGGIVALHVAQHLDPLGVLLIGSIRTPAELPCYGRLARPLRPLIPFIPVRLLQICCRPMISKLAQRAFPYSSAIARQFYKSDPRILKWSFSRILDWKAAPHVHCPIFQIHGDRDCVLPLHYTHPDAIVKGGGHVISLTHPSEVNDYIRSVLSEIVASPAEA